MKETGIPFNGPMVQAIIAGRKMQTRRVARGEALRWLEDTQFNPEFVADPAKHLSPYGYACDRLWVREAWRVGKPNDATAPRDILPPLLERGQGVTVLYEAGGWRSVGPEGRDEPVYPDDAPMPEWAGRYRPAMFMPRALSRITLEVTCVRIERLQGISEEDAQAEGCDQREINPVGWYAELWDSLNAARGFGWGVNPWVWVIEFRRIT